MEKRLRVLNISDSGISSQKIIKELSKAGYMITIELVSSFEELRERVAGKDWDIVLFDGSFKLFGSSEANELVHETKNALSMIVYCENDEDIYVMEPGTNIASSYILRCSMNNLGMAVQQELYRLNDKRTLNEVQQRFGNESELLNITLNSIGDGVITTDIEGKIAFMNRIGQQLTGYGLESAQGQPLDKVFNILDKESRKPAENPFLQVKQAGNAVGLKKNTVLLSMDGAERYISASIAPISDKSGSLVGVIVVFRDITRIMGAEEELQRAKEAAEAASKAKSEFLANMSHEIRTPLNGIIGMTDLTMLTELSVEQRENLSIVKNCAESLMSVINDILDFSKIEAGKMAISKIEFDLPALMERTVKTHSVRANEKGLRLNLALPDDIPSSVSGDPHRLLQILNNLIGNAVKFTEIGEVSLGIEKEEQSDEEIKLKFSVSDTGIGIEENEMVRLFKSFSQVDSSISRKYGGTGLGLAISKRLVEMMGGDIWVDSQKGSGSVFYFTCTFGLNTASEKEDENNNILPENMNSNSAKVLIVEDDKVCQIVAGKMIIENGGTVTIANNGQEALSILETQNFDLILMDIQMPGMDGMETTRIIRDREKGSDRHVPVIALTAFALAGDKQKFINAGMDDYVSKPIKMSEFVETISKYLHRPEIQAASEEMQMSMTAKEDAANLFLSDIPEYWSRLADAVENNDINKIERFAHIIKILAYENEIEAVKRVAFKIELAARRRNLDEINELYNTLKIELNKVKQLEN